MKWGVFANMVASVAYLIQYVLNYLVPSPVLIIFAVLCQFLLGGLLLLCQQWELELEEAMLVEEKRR